MNKNFKTIITALVLTTLFTTPCLAAGGVLKAADTDTPSSSQNDNNGNKDNTDNSTSSNSYKPYMYPGSESNPYNWYKYTNYTDYLRDTLKGNLKAMSYRLAKTGQASDNVVYKYAKDGDSVWEGDNGDWYKTFNPDINYNVSATTSDVEVNRITDYYNWVCTGGESWTIQGEQYKSVVFNKVGTYTITSTPHQIIYREKRLSSTGTVYDQFKNGSTSNIDTINFSETFESYTTTVDRTDLAKTWTFKITPPEINIPIIPEIIPVTPTPLPEFDTVLIQ